jgi:hypothetical protein
MLKNCQKTAVGKKKKSKFMRKIRELDILLVFFVYKRSEQLPFDLIPVSCFIINIHSQQPTQQTSLSFQNHNLMFI